MDSLTNFDYAFSAVYQAMRKKDYAWHFSASPDDLFFQIVDELEIANHRYMEIIYANQWSLKAAIVKLIREQKENNQLALLEVPVHKRSYQEKIAERIKYEFPGACIRRFKKTRLRYGAVQAAIEFPDRKPATLLELI